MLINFPKKAAGFYFTRFAGVKPTSHIVPYYFRELIESLITAGATVVAGNRLESGMRLATMRGALPICSWTVGA